MFLDPETYPSNYRIMETCVPSMMTENSLDLANHILSYVTQPTKSVSNFRLPIKNTAVPPQEVGPISDGSISGSSNKSIPITNHSSMGMVSQTAGSIENTDRLCLYISGIFSLKGLVDLDCFNDDETLECTSSTSNPLKPGSVASANVPQTISAATPNIKTPIVVTRTSGTDNGISITPVSIMSRDPNSKQNTCIPVLVRPRDQPSSLIENPSLSKMKTSDDPDEPPFQKSHPGDQLYQREPSYQPTNPGEPSYPCEVPGYHHDHTCPKRVFRCNICGYEFSQKGNLLTHLRIHEDERPYQCNECGYAARQMVQLKRHAKHHIFKFQYKCRFCTYSSKMKSTTTKHCMLVHAELFKALNIDRYK